MKTYDKYKDSGVEWIGEIPEHWDFCHLQYHMDFMSGYAFKSAEYDWNKGVKLVRGINVKEGSFKWGDLTRYWSRDTEKISQYYLEEGDVLIAMDGSKVGKNFAIVSDEDLPLLLLQRVARLRLKSTLHPKYLFWCISTKMFLYYINISKTDPAVPHISPYDIAHIPQFIPLIEEQESIATFLDSKTKIIDALIKKTEQKIEILKEQRTAIINQAVTCGLDEQGELRERPESFPAEGWKDSGVEWIGWVPKEWNIISLNHLGETQNGVSKGGAYFGSGYPFISYSDVYKNLDLNHEIKGLALSSEDDRNNFSVLEGDVFFTRTSETIEEIGISSTCMKDIENAVFAGFLIRFRPNKDQLVKEYSKYYFRSSTTRTYFISRMNIVTRASLSQELLKTLPVCIPTIKEQLQIGKFLKIREEKTGVLLRNYHRQIVQLKEYRQSLISEVVTGKIKVTD